jgi:hypothetical protein
MPLLQLDEPPAHDLVDGRLHEYRADHFLLPVQLTGSRRSTRPLGAGCRDRKLTISAGPAFRDLVGARGANGQRLLPRSFREALDVRGGQQHWRRYRCKGKQSKLLPSGGVGL